MFLGGLSIAVLDQLLSMLPDIDTSRVFICCSGSFRSERTIHLYDKTAQLYSNDVSLFSCVLGGLLAGEPVEFRFKDELAFLEDLLVGASPVRRAGAVAFALDITNWASGKPNPYKQAHYRHLTLNAPHYLDLMQAKVASAFGDLRLAGFAARDWIEHMEQALAEGASVVTFPPFYKGDYEKLYAWLDARVDWPRPTYPLYDPKKLPELADRIRASGSPYIFISNQRLEGHEPKALWRAAGRADCWLYASASVSGSRLSRPDDLAKVFFYEPLIPARLTATSRIRVERAEAPHALYVRRIYCKKSIMITSASFNFFVYIDDMLAGALAYNQSDLTRSLTGREDIVYLLSDMAVTSERRISKLIVRLARNRQVLRAIAARTLRPINIVETTAYCDHPVSMKYRGLFKVAKRQSAPPPMDGYYKLQLVGEALEETPEDAYRWWWDNHAETEIRGGRRAAAREPRRQLVHA